MFKASPLGATTNPVNELTHVGKLCRAGLPAAGGYGTCTAVCVSRAIATDPLDLLADLDRIATEEAGAWVLR